MRSESIQDMFIDIPLETKIKVSVQAMMIKLLSDVGFREGYWTEDEDPIMEKLIKCSEELTKMIIEDIDECKIE